MVAANPLISGCFPIIRIAYIQVMAVNSRQVMKLIVIQDENIKGWHSGLFGKQLQNSALGTLKRKLQSNPKVLVIDRFFPSTRICPRCGAINEGITPSDRIFTCGCGYAEDRDVKAAKTLLLAGEHEISCTRAEHTGTPEERMSDFDISYEIWKQSALSPEAPSSKRQRRRE